MKETVVGGCGRFSKIFSCFQVVNIKEDTPFLLPLDIVESAHDPSDHWSPLAVSLRLKYTKERQQSQSLHSPPSEAALPLGLSCGLLIFLPLHAKLIFLQKWEHLLWSKQTHDLETDPWLAVCHHLKEPNKRWKERIRPDRCMLDDLRWRRGAHVHSLFSIPSTKGSYMCSVDPLAVW